MLRMGAAGKLGEFGVASITEIFALSDLRHAIRLDRQFLQLAEEFLAFSFRLLFVRGHRGKKLLLLHHSAFEKDVTKLRAGLVFNFAEASPPSLLLRGGTVVQNRIYVERHAGLMRAWAHFIRRDEQVAQAI